VTELTPPPADPTRHWDGQKWLKWDGTSWCPEPAQLPRRPLRNPRRPQLVTAKISDGGTIALIVLAASWWVAGTCFIHKSYLPVSGTLTLTDTPFVGAVRDSPCVGTGGFSDIAPGASVVVADEHGTILGTGALGAGTINFRYMRFHFHHHRREAGHSFYGVTVSHRGAVQFQEDRLGDVGLTLGG